MRFIATFVLASLTLASIAAAREWTDSTGKIKQEADLVDFDDSIAVLKKADGRLVAIEIEDLSKEDREYLASKGAKDEVYKSASKDRTWTCTDGEKVTGRVVRYGIKDVVISRKGGKLSVNDKPYSDLTRLQQTVIPKIVAAYEKKPIKDVKGIESLIASRKGEPLKYTVEGVELELENGEPFAVPFFLFSEKDLEVLKPGWDEWLEAKNNKVRQQEESTMLRSLANEYQRDRAITNQILMLRLASDWFDLWEVELIAANGTSSSVVVPARDSRQAQVAAKQMYPAAGIGAAQRVSRRN